MIDIRLEALFHGPNIWAPAPVLVASVRRTQPLARDVALACERLRALWPDWLHGQRSVPDETTEVAGLMAAWALGALNERRGCVSEAGARATPEGARLWLGFHHPELSRLALALARRAVLEAAGPSGDEQARAALDGPLQRLWDLCQRHHPDYQARILMEGARAMGVPTLPFVPGSRYWQYGWGARARVFMESASNADGLLGAQWQRSKALSHAVFTSLGVPTPAHRLVQQPGELEAAATAVGWPCVVKPTDRGGGRGVTAGIASLAALLEAFAHARRFTQGPVMVEAFVPGEDHRLMVVDGRLVAAIRREPSSVVGDGRRTLRELVQALNATRSANMVKSRYLRPIAFDGLLIGHLAGQGLSLDAVLASDRRVGLRSNANLSGGGICTDVTANVHPAVRRMAEAVSAAFGLGTAGLDYLTTDIGEAPRRSGGQLIEINTTPGLDAAIAAGWAPAAIARAVLGERPGRVPVTLALLPPAALALVVKAFRAHPGGPGVGWACGCFAEVGGVSLQGAADDPWAGTRAALRLPALRTLTVLSTPAELMRQGLPVDAVARALLCGVELPEIWQAVVERHADVTERLPGGGDAVSWMVARATFDHKEDIGEKAFGAGI